MIILILSDDPTKDLENFIQDLIDTGENKASEWENRQEEVNTSWETWRPFMMERIVEAHAVMGEDNWYFHLLHVSE